MPSVASNSAGKTVVVLGTGGTIAGVAARADDHVGYRAGQLGAEALVAAVPALGGRSGLTVEAETLAQLDSCDMDHGTWLALREHAQAVLARPEVAGLVVTHGTDTLEETAYFLHRTLAVAKPVVFTAAMRPATALSADGPQNLLDAVLLAATPGARGVLVAFAGKVFGAADLRKVHGYRVEAFDAGDAGAIGVMADGSLQRFRAWPDMPAHAASAALPPATAWPVVDIVTSHAGARGAVIDALVAAGARGIVVAGTGNGSVHRNLVEAARRAEAAGVVVRRASRCQLGGVVGARPDSLPTAGMRTAPQARIELMLDLMLDPIAAAR
ncbi:MAG: asparaginase [Burkholderiales bacterium]|nr:asparaginase [Burkholderiales bacterium]